MGFLAGSIRQPIPASHPHRSVRLAASSPRSVRPGRSARMSGLTIREMGLACAKHAASFRRGHPRRRQRDRARRRPMGLPLGRGSPSAAAGTAAERATMMIRLSINSAIQIPPRTACRAGHGPARAAGRDLGALSTCRLPEFARPERCARAFAAIHRSGHAFHPPLFACCRGLPAGGNRRGVRACQRHSLPGPCRSGGDGAGALQHHEIVDALRAGVEGGYLRASTAMPSCGAV